MHSVFIALIAFALGLAYSGDVFGADAVTIYKTQCAACHGLKGEGIPGMAPPHKGNEFITKGKPEDIKKTILEGRAGKAKKYDVKQYPVDMPKAPVTEAEADELVKYLKNDLQK